MKRKNGIMYGRKRENPLSLNSKVKSKDKKLNGYRSMFKERP